MLSQENNKYKCQSCYTVRYFNAFQEVRLLSEPKNFKQTFAHDWLLSL
jgi:hypothetical protein